MIFVLFGGLALAVVLWVMAEIKQAKTSTRIALAAIPMMMLSAMLLSLAQSRMYQETHYRGALRLLGEVLDEGDIEAAKRAIKAYNEGGHLGYIIMESLSNWDDA